MKGCRFIEVYRSWWRQKLHAVMKQSRHHRPKDLIESNGHQDRRPLDLMKLIHQSSAPLFTIVWFYRFAMMQETSDQQQSTATQQAWKSVKWKLTFKLVNTPKEFWWLAAAILSMEGQIPPRRCIMLLIATNFLCKHSAWAFLQPKTKLPLREVTIFNSTPLCY